MGQTEVIPETCRLVKTGPEQNYFQVKTALNRTVSVFPVGLKQIPSHSKNMWFGQDWRKTVLLPAQSKPDLNRSAFVFQVALKVIPETCGLAKTGPQRY